jgi:hypothetical protein
LSLEIPALLVREGGVRGKLLGLASKNVQGRAVRVCIAHSQSVLEVQSPSEGPIAASHVSLGSFEGGRGGNSCQ